jgi:hypothetical protein
VKLDAVWIAGINAFGEVVELLSNPVSLRLEHGNATEDQIIF